MERTPEVIITIRREKERLTSDSSAEDERMSQSGNSLGSGKTRPEYGHDCTHPLERASLGEEGPMATGTPGDSAKVRNSSRASPVERDYGAEGGRREESIGCESGNCGPERIPKRDR